MKRVYMCDFETTTKEDDCRVWAGCAVDLATGETAHISTDINSFMEWMSKESKKVYYHNLKFDGEFILSWLLFNGFTHIGNDKKAIPEGHFQTLIDDMGQFYRIAICFKRTKRQLIICEIYDSLKKLPDKAARIAKDYGLPIAKGEIDYTMDRPQGYQPTEEEIDYITTDCRIIQMALNMQFEQGMKKLTIASDSLAFYKAMMGRKFDYWFPVLPKMLDDDIRPAYKGGFTWCNPIHAGKDMGEGIVLDVNSLYPDAMYNNPLPWGYPTYFEGEPPVNDMYPLYIVRIRCAFKVKKDHIPTIQIKGSFWTETEYLTSTEVKHGRFKDFVEVDLTLTNIDLQLFLDHYDIIGDIKYISGFMFKAQKGMFQDYIDHWMEIKATAPKGSAMRAIAKLHLNSLYGKFATGTEKYNKVPVLCPDGVVRYYCRNKPARDENGNIRFCAPDRIEYERDDDGEIVHIDPEITDPIYTPVATFITAYARNKTIRAAQAVYHRFIYADTDSLHLIGTEIPEGLEIHPSKLGAWDHEKTFQRARFIRAKTYVEEVDGHLDVTCAGMPDNVKELVTWDNFHEGMSYPGKLLPKRVKGGIVLSPIDFTIKL